MRYRDNGETEYQDVGGIQTYVHRPTDSESFVNDRCGYDTEDTDIERFTDEEKGDLGEYAAVEYAKSQGYENIQPTEVDTTDKGLDVVAFDPETEEVVVIEAKTRSNKFSKHDLGKPKIKARTEDGRSHQLEDQYNLDDAIEKVMKANPEATKGVPQKTREGMLQAGGEAYGYRKEFVGVQIGGVDGDPIDENLSDVGIERAHITQIPESDPEQASQTASSDGTGSVVDDPWGADHDGFSVDNPAERRQVELSEKEEEFWDSVTDEDGELEEGVVTFPEWMKPDPYTHPEDRNAPDPSELTDIKSIGPSRSADLEAEGYGDIEDIIEANQEELTDVFGIGEETADRLQDAAERYEVSNDSNHQQTGNGESGDSKGETQDRAASATAGASETGVDSSLVASESDATEADIADEVDLDPANSGADATEADIADGVDLDPANSDADATEVDLDPANSDADATEADIDAEIDFNEEPDQKGEGEGPDI